MINTEVGMGDTLKLKLGGSLFNSEGIAYKNNRLLSCKNNSFTSIHITEGTEVICNGAFTGCYNLREISFPSTLKAIGYEAFKNCKSLESIVIPGSIIQIDRLAFQGCSNLKKVVILPGNERKEIDNDVFPLTIKEIYVYDSDLVLRWNNFIGVGTESSYNYMTPAKTDMHIYVCREKFERYRKEIGKLAYIETFNYRPSVNLGFNPCWNINTVAKINMKIGEGAYLWDFGNDKKMVMAAENTMFSVAVSDLSGRLITIEQNLMVDGSLGGILNRTDIYLNNREREDSLCNFDFLPKEWASAFKLENIGNEEAIYQNALEEYIKDQVGMHGKELNNPLDSKVLPVKIIKVTDKNPLELEFTVRAVEGFFNPTKLNFIYYKESNISKLYDFLHILSHHKGYLLNVIDYDGILFGLQFIRNYEYENSQIIDSFEFERVWTKSIYRGLLGNTRLPLIRTYGDHWAPEEIWDPENED